MSGINFLYENYIDDATMSITTGAENAQFPLNNLANVSPSVKFRSTGNTVVIEIDMLQTRDIDTIAVAGDPTGVFGATSIDVRTSTTTDFSGSAVNSLDLSSSENLGYKFIDAVSHRYVEITMAGTGSYVELGSLFVGSRLNLPNQSISIDSFIYGRTDKSNTEESRYGQKFIDRRNDVKFIAGSLQYCLKAEQEELDTMWIRQGRNKPVWMFLDPDSDGMIDGKFKLSIYGYLLRTPRWSAAGGQHYSCNFRLIEVI